MQGDDDESKNDAVEVISISSDSPSSSPRPARRICGKVPMSHPHAYMDPDFLLKKARFTPSRKTRSRSGDLITGLPAKTTGRKRTSKVYSCFIISFAVRNMTRHFVNFKSLSCQTSPPTSGDSATSALPTMVRVQG